MSAQRIATVLQACYLAFVLPLASESSAQDTLPDVERLKWLSPAHGVNTIPLEARDLIARDSAWIRLFADVLEGRRLGSRVWYRDVVLWWLAESGDPKYLPTFLEYARLGSGEGDFRCAVYGLARHARLPEATERLIELLTSGSRAQKARVVFALMHVNDEDARSVIRTVPAAELPEELANRVEHLLRTPPLPPGVGRFPCGEGREFGRDDDGVFRCIEKRSR